MGSKREEWEIFVGKVPWKTCLPDVPESFRVDFFQSYIDVVSVGSIFET